MDDSSVCSRCGAMVPLPDGNGVTTCPSCGRRRRSKATATAGTVGASAAADSSSPATGPSYPGGPSGRTGGSGCLRPLLKVAGVVILLIAVITVAGRFERPDPSSIPSHTGAATVVGRSPLILPTGSGTDLIVITRDRGGRDPDRHVERLALLDGRTLSRWRSPKITGVASNAVIAASADTVYVAIDNRLWAYDAARGTLRWTTAMADTTAAGCGDCLAVVGDRLVTRTADATVAVYGARSAEPLWSRRLTSPQGTMTVAGPRVLLTDEATPGGGASVTTFDPATLTEGHPVTPTCTNADGYEAGLDLGPHTRAIPGTDDAVAVFGYGTTCVVRWTVTTGAVQPPIPVVTGSMPSIDLPPLVTDEVVAFGTADGPVHLVPLAGGPPIALATPTEVTGQPLFVVDGALVAQTTSTRGSETGGLIAWDVATGATRWTAPLPHGARPVASLVTRTGDVVSDRVARSLVSRDGDAVWVTTFRGGREPAVEVGRLDLGTGTVVDPLRSPLPLLYPTEQPYVSVAPSEGRHVVLTVDAVLGWIDLDRPTVHRFPPEK